MNSSTLSRRTILQLAGAAALPLSSGLLSGSAHAATPGTLTIAYNVNLPSFDPTVGLSAVNPTIQSIYQSVFDTYIGQAPDLSFKPGLLTKWGWNADRTKITLELRKGATWHDGSPVTPEDVVWSLTRAADPKGGNPIQFVWSKIGNYKIDGNTITGDVLECLVLKPPQTPEQAMQLAAEQWIFCDDIVGQGTQSIRNLAIEIWQSKTWFFWWD